VKMKQLPLEGMATTQVITTCLECNAAAKHAAVLFFPYYLSKKPCRRLEWQVVWAAKPCIIQTGKWGPLSPALNKLGT
jgi:hypothetical protein